MEQNKAQNFMFKLIVGGSILLIGIGALASNFVSFNFWDVFGKWWPVFVLLYGISQFISQPKTYLGSLLVVAFGVIALLNNLGVLSINPFSLIFPLILIFVGLRIVFNSTVSRIKSENKENFFNSIAIFGASDIVMNSTNFEGGMITSLFGGSKVDLRKAKISETGASIDLNVAFGGVEVIIPDGWQVRFDCVPVFGGWSNKAQSADGPILSIKGLIFCGGAEVKLKDDGN
jgi:predicted membrane protein